MLVLHFGQVDIASLPELPFIIALINVATEKMKAKIDSAKESISISHYLLSSLYVFIIVVLLYLFVAMC